MTAAKKTQKPVLDKQQAELLNDQLMEAFEKQYPVSIYIHENGETAELTGHIKYMDSQTDSVTLEITDDSLRSIAFRNILSITTILIIKGSVHPEPN